MGHFFREVGRPVGAPPPTAQDFAHLAAVASRYGYRLATLEERGGRDNVPRILRLTSRPTRNIHRTNWRRCMLPVGIEPRYDFVGCGSGSFGSVVAGAIGRKPLCQCAIAGGRWRRRRAGSPRSLPVAAELRQRARLGFRLTTNCSSQR
jgi:hypothetical protein